MSGNSFGLYSSSGGNVTVGAGNTSGLYRLDTAVIVDTGYGNVDVQAFLEQYTGNIQCGNIDVLNTANINALYATNYYYANGTPFVPSGYGNANVAAFLPTYTGNLAGSNLGLTGNILVGQNIVATGNVTTGQNMIAGGDVQAAGNLRTTGASGNITGANYVVASYFVGDGSQLSNVSGSFGNAQVANLLASGTLTSNIVTTGNVSGTYILGDGSQLTGLPATFGNANVVTLLANFGSNTISTTGNITGGLFTGSGAGLTAIPGANVTGTVANAAYATDSAHSTVADSANSVTGGNVVGQVANALVAGTVYTAAQPNITSVGTLTSLAVTGNITANNISTTGNVTVSGRLESDDITATDITVYGNQVITGNLTVQGNTTTINSNVIVTNDKTITVANNQSTGANVNGAGIEAGNPAVATWLYSDASTSWQSNISITPNANLTNNLGTNTLRWATVFGGDANLSGNVNAVNVTASSNVAAANVVATYLYGDGSNITGVTAGAADLVYLPVKNTSGGTLVKGTPVYATGTVGSGTTVEVSASRADTASTMAAIGLLTSDLNNNDSGQAVTVGALGNYDTSTYTVGQQLYVAATGGLTSSRPTGSNVVQLVGTVGRVNASTGSINVNIWDFNQLPNLGNGNVWIGNAAGYPTETVAYGNSNVTSLLANFGSNVISTTGNITGGNIIATTDVVGGNVVIPSGKDLLGDFGSSANISKTWVQTNVGTGTWFQVRPNAATGGTASVGVFGSNNVGNTNSMGIYADDDQVYIRSGSSGTGTLRPLQIYMNSTEIARFGTDGNVGFGNTAPTDKLAVSGTIYASGNITGSYFIGNGSQLTGIVSTYGNANVTSLLASLGSNVISSTANITTTANVSANSAQFLNGGKIQGDFSSGPTAGRTIFQTTSTTTSGSTFISAVPGANNTATNQSGFGAFGNADLGNATFMTSLMTSTDGRIQVSRNGTGSFLPFTIYTSNAERVRTDINGNVGIANAAPLHTLAVSGTGYVSGNISVGGILTDGYYYANGTPFTGSGSTYGNANVASFLATFGANVIDSTGNITTTANVSAGYFIGNGSQLTGITSSYGDANVTTLLASLGSNVISSTANIVTTGNVSGGNILGVGSNLTGINAFGNIAVSGQTTVSADNTTDTLTLVAGTNITITTDAANNKITITSTASGGGETLSPFLLMGG